MRGLVVIAIKPIQDEELFLNYRYNPKLPVPDWYVPVDKHEAYARWKQSK